MPHLFTDEHYQPEQGMQLQGGSRSPQRASTRSDEICDRGQEVRQASSALPQDNRTVCASFQGEVGAREPERVPVSETIYGEHASGTQAGESRLLCFQGTLYEANTLVDESGVHSEGYSRVCGKEVQPSMCSGEERGEGQVGSRQCDRPGKQSSSIRRRAAKESVPEMLHLELMQCTATV